MLGGGAGGAKAHEHATAKDHGLLIGPRRGALTTVVVSHSGAAFTLDAPAR